MQFETTNLSNLARASFEGIITATELDLVKTRVDGDVTVERALRLHETIIFGKIQAETVALDAGSGITGRVMCGSLSVMQSRLIANEPGIEFITVSALNCKNSQVNGGACAIKRECLIDNSEMVIQALCARDVRLIGKSVLSGIICCDDFQCNAGATIANGIIFYTRNLAIGPGCDLTSVVINKVPNAQLVYAERAQIVQRMKGSLFPGQTGGDPARLEPAGFPGFAYSGPAE